jgi:large subunit ribosomal protein L1
MAKVSKRHSSNAEKVDRLKRYELDEAIELLKSLQKVKFEETFEAAIKLGVDPKKSDQMVRGVAKLPYGTGRTVRVLVFAKGEKEQEARDAGAEYVGAEDLVEKIKGGWLDFDKAIATPDMMPKVGPIAKILGPRGLMPNPKVGTVTQDVGKAVSEVKAGQVEFRVEKGAIVHAPFRKTSFDTSKLVENFITLLDQVIKLKPATSKGNYLQGIAITTTMGPGLKIDPVKAQQAASRG